MHPNHNAMISQAPVMISRNAHHRSLLQTGIGQHPSLEIGYGIPATA
jgi:hypothetical protein